MTLEEIEVGMLVHLNSGSPALTVTEIDEDSAEVTVDWIATESHEHQTAVFPVVCVKILELGS